ncbi:MAG: hypothetical protein ATN36_02395 [Epulopiscium sp. Nele67-Bin005]|nr:MAG: hypothetical protein ATN36_02395 [Epulopiscium sp. Nele67-Bin005]
MKNQQICELFIENRDILKKIFIFTDHQIYHICAMIFADKGQLADPQKLEDCKNLLKNATKNTFGLSMNFRGYSHTIFICMLSISDNPEQKLEQTIKLYSELKAEFSGSEYLALGAMIMTEYTTDYEQITTRAKEIYTDMRANHPFLTSNEDSVFSLLLSLSEKSTKLLNEEIEKHYEECKEKFGKSNAVQALSHVLALTDGNAHDVINLYEDLRNRGYKYGTQFELPALGIVAKLGEKNDIINELIEVDQFLSNQKGYQGIFSLSKKQRLMHASCLVMSNHLNKSDTNINLYTSTISAIAIAIAQQIALIIIIASSTAVTNANN